MEHEFRKAFSFAKDTYIYTILIEIMYVKACVLTIYDYLSISHSSPAFGCKISMC